MGYEHQKVTNLQRVRLVQFERAYTESNDENDEGIMYVTMEVDDQKECATNASAREPLTKRRRFNESLVLMHENVDDIMNPLVTNL